MQPRIVIAENRVLAGISTRMSLANNQTAKLWGNFMSKRKDIANAIGTDLYSVQVYDKGFDMGHFTPETVFTKWAGIEVKNLEGLPEGFCEFILPGGLYAVFRYKGKPSAFANTAQYIYGQWLPKSGYGLDDRPHFEVLGEKYKGEHIDSEEDIWVPVRPGISS